MIIFRGFITESFIAFNADLPHDMDFPYVIRIIDDLRVIRPYHILIRKTCIPQTKMITDDLKLICR